MILEKKEMKAFSINNLLYEEIVLLQSIMVHVSNDIDYMSTMDTESIQIFNDLCNKIIES